MIWMWKLATKLDVWYARYLYHWDPECEAN